MTPIRRTHLRAGEAGALVSFARLLRITFEDVKGWIDTAIAIGALAGLAGGLPVYRNYKKRKTEERERNEKRDTAIDQVIAMRERFDEVADKVAVIEATMEHVSVSCSRLEAGSRRGQKAAEEALWECNAEGYCIAVNPSWEALFGLTSEQAVGLGWRQALHPDDRERVWHSWEKSLDAWKRGEMRGVDWQENYRILRRDGAAPVNCLAQASPYFDHLGRIAGFVGVTKQQS